jgi:hypothetical protein
MPDDRVNGSVADHDAGRGNRKFSVSANRGRASHKVRYVEVGGSAVDTEECAFCEAVPDLSGPDKSERP